jgi:hypothetical protein
VTRLLIGTAEGLFELDGKDLRPDDELGERDVTALAVDVDEVWAIIADRSLLRRDASGGWTEVASSDSYELTCVVASAAGVFVGTEEAHLLRLEDSTLAPVDGLERVEGRDAWYTPWGGPPAVRSLAADRARRLHANVHVGGIPRSTDGGASWEPTIDIDSDIHQVLAHPSEPDVLLAAGAVGLAISEDGGSTWRIESDGLHSTYARAVAVADTTVLVTASSGPRGGRAAVYRTTLAPGSRLERCTDGLPEWFDGNIDTGWLAAAGSTAAFAATGGLLFSSDDAGATWTEVADGLPRPRWLAFA